MAAFDRLASPTSRTDLPAPARKGTLKRKHVLMLALAMEVLAVGISYADRYQRRGILVEQPVTIGHAIV